MNLLQQLELANRPWVRQPDPVPNRRGNPNPNNQKANRAKRAKAIAKYKTAFDAEWVEQSVIENKLGTGHYAILKTLRRWEEDEIVESRPSGGDPESKTMDWRFKEETLCNTNT